MRCEVGFGECNSAFEIKLCGADSTFPVEFDGAASLREYEDYTGSYDVTPMVTSQTLSTKDKHMLNDVIVRTIPTREVTNDEGGVTFIIGG